MIGAASSITRVSCNAQVLSQVLVPPLAEQYDIVKAEWVKQGCWKDDTFIQLWEDDCADAEVFEAAVDQCLEM